MSSPCPDGRAPISLCTIVLHTVLLGSLCGCEREMRQFESPPSAAVGPKVRHTSIQPVQAMPNAASSAPNLPSTAYRYEENAFAVSQGKRLYRWYNCSSCHAPGGGGDWGPALSDEQWIYGSAPNNIFASIVEGRPAGMPSFGGHIPEDQVWQLVAFVRSLSGQLRSDVASGRSDGMSGWKPEAARDREEPRPMEKPDGNQR